MLKKPVSRLFLMMCYCFGNLYPFTAHASGPLHQVQASQFSLHSKELLFEENKGQISQPSAQIKYYAHSNGVYLYCKPGMISFVFTKTETDKSVSEATGENVETHCMRLTLAQAFPRTENRLGPTLPQDAFNASLRKKITTSHLDLLFLHSNPSPSITASDQQEYYENR